MNCPLCNTAAPLFETIKARDYFRCEECHGIFMNPDHYLPEEKEKERYLEHNNNVEDLGYQNFVQPLVSRIIEEYEPTQKGLDFGSGTGPVISKMLHDKNFDIVTYDPFFENIPERLTQTYDYIVSCEVIEHFHHPYKEFKLLKSLLSSNGSLLCKTHMYDASVDFKSWYYKDDPTHVFIYHAKTMEWIKNEFNFKEVSLKNRMIHFRK